MWQFISGRFWLTIGALLGLTVVVTLVTGKFSSAGDSGPSGQIVIAGDRSPPIDFIAPIASVRSNEGFTLTDGVTTADIALTIDTTRTMVVKAGTPGVWECPDATQPGSCVVAAKLMGDAVLWFAVMPSLGPSTTTDTLKLPAVVELLKDGWVRLANGWVVHHASVVDRFCEAETTSFSDFIDQFGAAATSTFDLVTNEIVKVTCPRT